MPRCVVALTLDVDARLPALDACNTRRMGKLNKHVLAVTCVCVPFRNLILECVVVLVVVLMDIMFGHWHKAQEQGILHLGSL